MKNQVFAEGRSVVYTNAGSAILAGALVKIGARYGVASVDIANGASGVVQLIGVYNLKKEASETWAVGDKLFVKESSMGLTKTALGNVPAGFAHRAAESADVLGDVNLGAQAEAGQAVVIAAISTADGSDAATTQALANATKAKVNAILVALKDAGLMANS
jgi:predicted RecA/RadA family phage recombinase